MVYSLGRCPDIVRAGYLGRFLPEAPVKTILAEELHILPPASEIALVVFFLLEIVLKRESPSGVMQISIVIFSIDAAAQMLLKRTACSKQ